MQFVTVQATMGWCSPAKAEGNSLLERKPYTVGVAPLPLAHRGMLAGPLLQPCLRNSAPVAAIKSICSSPLQGLLADLHAGTAYMLPYCFSAHRERQHFHLTAMLSFEHTNHSTRNSQPYRRGS